MQRSGNDKNRLLEFIDKVKQRLNLNLFADMLVYGLIGGFAGWAIVSILSLFVPLYNAEKYGAYLIIPCAIAGIVMFFVKRFGRKEAALKADLTGLKERVTTAYENLDKDDTFTLVQRADAIRTIERYDVKEHFPFRVSIKKLAILLTLVLAVTTTMLIPSKARAKAQVQHGIKVEAEKVIDKLEKQVKDLQETYKLTDEQIKELEDLLNQAKKELRDALSEEDLSKAEERFQAKLDQKLKDDLTDNAAKAAEAQKNASLLDQMSDAEKQAALDNIKQQAEALNNEELRQAAEQAQQELNNGQLSEDAIQQLKDAAQQAVDNANKDLQNAGIKNSGDNNPNNSSNSGGQTPTGNPSQSGGQTPTGNPSQSGGQTPTGNPSQSGGQTPTGNPSQSGSQTPGNNPGDNPGNQPGNQPGDQPGNQPGDQPGNQPGNQPGDQPGNQPGGGDWNMGSDKGNEKDPTGGGERIFVPNEQSDENLHGKNGPGSESQTQTGQSFTWDGTSVDYSTVISDYTKKAYEDLNQTDVPPSMQELIKDYFTEINK